jgi:hypothetical protein
VYEQPWLVDYPCLYSLSGDFTVTYAVSTNSFVTSGIPVLAYGVEILWQGTDFVSTTSSSTISLSPSSSTPSATLIFQPNSLSSKEKSGDRGWRHNRGFIFYSYPSILHTRSALRKQERRRYPTGGRGNSEAGTRRA